MKTKHFFFQFLCAAVFCCASLSAYADTTYELIKEGVIDTENFISDGLTVNDCNVTVGDVTYTKEVQMSDYAGEAQNIKLKAKVIQYNAKTTQTTIKVVAYNTSAGNNRYFCFTAVPEGATYSKDTHRQRYQISKNGGTMSQTYTQTNSTNASYYFHLDNNPTDIRILSISITESGTPLPMAGQGGYSFNFYKGRLIGPKSVVNKIEGMEIVPQTDYSCFVTQSLSIKNGTTPTWYVKFTNLTNISLTTTQNTTISVDRQYYLSHTLTGTDILVTPPADLSGVCETNLTPGTWYLHPINAKTVALSSISFTALNPTYNASFASGKEGVPAPSTQSNVEYVTLEEIKNVIGFLNNGWKADKDVKVNDQIVTAGNVLSIGDVVFLTDNTTFTAQWESAMEVKFMVDGNQLGATQYIQSGNYAVAPESPSKAGAQFLGWSIDGTEANIKNVAEYVITENTTFTAVWKAAATYSVNFYSEGKVFYSLENLTAGTAVTAPTSIPTWLAHKFLGWSDTEKGTTPFDFSSCVITDHDLNFYAIWKTPVEIFSLVVGTTTPTDMNNNERAMTAAEATVTAGAGYVGCTQEANKGVFGNNIILLGGDRAYIKVEMDNDLRQGDVLIFSNNQQNKLQFALTSARGRNTTIYTSEYSADDESDDAIQGYYEIPAGSDLIGRQTLYIWRLTSNTQAFISEIHMYRPDPEANPNSFYTLTFNSDGGTEVKAQKLLVGSNWVTVEPETPTRGTDLFLGWYAPEATDPFVFGNKLTSDLTLTAQWQTATAKTVRFFADGVQVGEDQQVEEGQPITNLPDDPEKEGYNFKGWSTDGTPENIVDFSTYLVSDDVDFSAVFAQIITVTVVDGVETEKKYEVGDLVRLTSPSKAGKIFTGWNLGDEAYNFATPLSEDITLTAQFADADPDHFTYAYNDAFHFDGTNHQRPDGQISNLDGAQSSPIATPYTLYAGEGGVTSVVVTGATCDDKVITQEYYVSSMFKMEAASTMTVVIKQGYEATLTLHAGSWDGTARTIFVSDAAPESGSVSTRHYDRDDEASKLTFTLTAGTHTLSVSAQMFIWALDIEATEMTYDVSLSDLTVGGVTVAGFNPTVTEYNVLTPYKSTELPTIVATASDPDNVTITPSQVGAFPNITYTIHVEANGDADIYRDYVLNFSMGEKDNLVLVRAQFTGANTCDKSGKFVNTTATEVQAQAGADAFGGYKFYGANSHITLAIEGTTYQEGDIANIYITTVGDNNATMALYTSKTGAEDTKIYDAGHKGVVGDNIFTLPVAANGLTELSFVRTATNAWNPNILFAEILRAVPQPLITSFTIAGVEATINQNAGTITAEIPYSASLTQTPVIETMTNSATFETLIDKTGEQDFTSPVTYTLTDKDGDTKQYTVTITRQAALSDDATLKSLMYGDKEITLVADQLTYDIALPFGTTAVPALSCETNHASATYDIVDATALPGSSTVTVTAEDNVTKLVYTVNFTVSVIRQYVIYDGTIEGNMSTNGQEQGFKWTKKGGEQQAYTLDASLSRTYDGKTYSYFVNALTNATTETNYYIEILIPEKYTAVFRLAGSTNTDNTNRGMFISKTRTNNYSTSIAGVRGADLNIKGVTSAPQQPGVYYLCTTGGVRLTELTVTLTPDEDALYEINDQENNADLARLINNQTLAEVGFNRPFIADGGYYTLCLPFDLSEEQVADYFGNCELAYLSSSELRGNGTLLHIDFTYVKSIEAGKPYLFRPTEDIIDPFIMENITIKNAATTTSTTYIDFIGTYKPIVLNSATDIFYVDANNLLFNPCDNMAMNALRCYFQVHSLSEEQIVRVMKRISLGTNTPEVSTEIVPVLDGQTPNGKYVKDGKLFIIRNRAIYNAQGQLITK